MRRPAFDRRLARPSVLLGLSILALLAVCAIGAPWLAPHDPHGINPSLKFLPPVWEQSGQREYLLGTDQLGRDLLSRLIYGARNSLMIAGSAVALAAAFGGLVGLIAGYARGAVDALLMRLADVQLAFPFILLALAILAVSETKTALRIIIVLAIADWVIQARVVRARVLVEREREYVSAARALGASHLRTMFRYILPTVLPTLIVIAMIELAILMVVEAILAFLGLGIDPPGISWGTILADGRVNIAIAWWMLAFPGVAIFLAVLGVNLFADGLADVLDPRLKITGRFGRRLQLAGRFGRSPVTPAPEGGAAAGASADGKLLSVRGLRTEFPEKGGVVVAVYDVGFDIAPGERLGIVGESGSGKTVTALSIIGLVDAPGHVTAGSIRLKGEELVGRPIRFMNKVRGNRIAMIFQDPGTSLNPSLKIGYQIAEAIRLHQKTDRNEASKRVLDALRLVNISDPERVADAYPFQLSGGMQQRAMIAMALSCHPELLIADEPTTALDVTTQAQILRELDALVRRLNTGVMLITHDLGVIAEFTDRTVVMYAGTVCEVADTEKIVTDPKHPYTKGLLEAVLALDDPRRSAATAIPGEPVDPRDRPPGCPFASRCRHVMDVCRSVYPEPRPADDGRPVACHLYPADAAGARTESDDARAAADREPA